MDAACKGRGINGPISAERHWGSWRLYNRNQAFWASSDGKTSHPCASLCSDQDTEKKEMRVRKVSQSELARWCICGPKGAVLNVL